jgi:hypothetical protein
MAVLGSTQVLGNLTATGDVIGDKVYNAIYNDYAEYFPRDEEIEPGSIVIKNTNGKGFINSIEPNSNLVVGVVSTDFAQCIGGDRNKSPKEQLEKYIPIALSGRVPVRVVGNIKIGDLIVSSHIKGVGTSTKEYIPGTVVGKALQDYNSEEEGKIEMLVMNL